MKVQDLPILGVCGWSGSGKTTLIEQLLGPLRERGLKVAVVKHDAHGADVDTPGKDSDRFFRTGADVLLEGPGELLMRAHPDADSTLASRLDGLVQTHDLVLVEGHKGTPIPKLWLLRDEADRPPPAAAEVRAVLEPGPQRRQRATALVEQFLAQQWRKPPVHGCVLIGGRSSRMGTPKHLLRDGGQTWLERTVRRLRAVCRRVLIAGSGEVPASLAGATRLPDAPDLAGPVAGILSAMRWSPRASWLVCACDLPEMSVDALQWLLSTRAPGAWATLPRLAGSAGVEPLLAHYDFRARALLERLAAKGRWRLNDLAGCEKVITPTPPAALTRAWRNANSPADLDRPA